MEKNRKEYGVKAIKPQAKDASKFLTEVSWDKAHVLQDFVTPWSAQGTSKVKFRALHDLKSLYFRFDVEDDSIYIDEKNNTNESVAASDRVELFFRKNKNLNPYYCMEIDSKARIMDFQARPDRDFDFS